ncbi:uncharacterized protein J3R85_003520 [Psidium guajava]|nr:uncharacterized protein J3R85_003520 [Psidium guajava]
MLDDTFARIPDDGRCRIWPHQPRQLWPTSDLAFPTPNRRRQLWATSRQGSPESGSELAVPGNARSRSSGAGSLTVVGGGEWLVRRRVGGSWWLCGGVQRWSTEVKCVGGYIRVWNIRL